MQILCVTCLFVALLGCVMGANGKYLNIKSITIFLIGFQYFSLVRCGQKGGVSGACNKMIKGYMYSAPKKSCFSMVLRGCATQGKFFDTKTDCEECLTF